MVDGERDPQPEQAALNAPRRRHEHSQETEFDRIPPREPGDHGYELRMKDFVDLEKVR